MSLQTLYKGAKIIETIENYSLADGNIQAIQEQSKDGYRFYSDEEFWTEIIRTPDVHWRKNIDLIQFTISSWVARVPGLYWTESSRIIRRHSSNDIAIQSKDWIEFNPPGKSKKVLGGIGCILLPPSEDGKVLMSVSSSCNSSLGIPMLVFPEVIDALNLKQGDVVNIRDAQWQPLSFEWSKRFSTTKDIPRGYLVIDRIEKIHVNSHSGNMPVVYHPFSIMEYQAQETLFYDFVFVTVDSKVKNANKEVEDFFVSYAKKDGRNGHYLLNPNIVEPIFESQYNSPADLQRPSEKAQLQLLYQRVRGANFHKTSLDKLISVLPQKYSSSKAIRKLAQDILVSPALLAEDNAASMSAQLINICIERGITEELIDRMFVEYPQIFQ